MDFNSLKDQVSNLTLYDLKAGVRKVQNAVMNYTEMEAKVREATNNEPWGASSTLMQEIANATHNYQLLNEIMPMIYKRFTEKTAEEWRQIYKALQLLEFLIKNGSERVVDDARSHVSLLRMLRQFHYIDQNGKDQGVNVRNRSQELAKLLSDVDAIRAERKKARANRNKFGGIEGGMVLSSFGGGSRYGGFGREDASYGGYSGGVYGDGGGFGGSTSGAYEDSGRRSNRFEEYDEGDDITPAPSTQRRVNTTSTTSARQESKKPEPSKKPELDLFSDNSEDLAAAPSISAPSNMLSSISGNQTAGGRKNTLVTQNIADDDDFDDFQSAPSSAQAAPSQQQFSSVLPPTLAPSTTPRTTQYAAPQPVSGAQNANLNGLVDFTSPSPSNISTTSTQPISLSGGLSAASIQSQPPKPAGYQAPQPNYFTSVPAPQPASQNQAKPPLSSLAPSLSGSKSASSPAATKAKSGGDAFGSLWSTASSNAGLKSTSTQQSKGPNLASMAKEKTSASLWGAPSATPNLGNSMSQGTKPQSSSSGFNDLLG
ncbi:hypothetical protein ACO22_00264 [Paracoccidioides brasiliensis]|uniref:ENTH domain-containing protein n=1 Tax=Paracoccidioides brasiliensis TaxID=121759 RepID=A0A1D2JQ07_PARBR|nr:hypothetical protein ACO22_00264 [Paracoccidioides brasiliensis]